MKTAEDKAVIKLPVTVGQNLIARRAGFPWVILTAPGEIIAAVPTEAEAHAIATALNSRDKLVEAAELAVQKWQIRNDLEWRRLKLPVPDGEPDWITELRSAIALARGKG